jgi:hypothetical protein
MKAYKITNIYEYYYFILKKRLFSFSTCWIFIFGGLKKRGVNRAGFPPFLRRTLNAATHYTIQTQTGASSCSWSMV